MATEATVTISAHHTRLGWGDLPGTVRERVERTLGGRVIDARSLTQGFSLGAVVRVVTDAGRTAVVKAVSAAVNERSMDLYRREAEILAQLARSPWVPTLRDQHDDGAWIVLLLDEVDGWHPGTPWTAADLRAVATACAGVQASRRATGRPTDLPDLTEVLASSMGGWRRLHDDRATDDPWIIRHLDRLVEIESGWREAVRGDALVHADLRSDNVLIGDRGAVLIDWPWACLGAPWFDVVLLGAAMDARGGPSQEKVLTVVDEADLQRPTPDQLLTVTVAVAGYYLDQARCAPPDGLRDPRPHQRARGRELLACVRRQTGWR